MLHVNKSASVDCLDCDGTGELQPSLSCCGGQGCGACTADPNGYILLRCGSCGGTGISRTRRACKACAYVGNLDEFKGGSCPDCVCATCGEPATMNLSPDRRATFLRCDRCAERDESRANC